MPAFPTSSSTQGRQEIANDQQAIMNKLDVIIGKQNQSLALAQQAQNALSNIQNLASQQAAATQVTAGGRRKEGCWFRPLLWPLED